MNYWRGLFFKMKVGVQLSQLTFIGLTIMALETLSLQFNFFAIYILCKSRFICTMSRIVPERMHVGCS